MVSTWLLKTQHINKLHFKIYIFLLQQIIVVLVGNRDFFQTHTQTPLNDSEHVKVLKDSWT